MAALLLLHVPPGVASARGVGVPMHTNELPVIGAGVCANPEVAKTTSAIRRTILFINTFSNKYKNRIQIYKNRAKERPI